jgi:circadian clock protein KaiC
LRLRALSALVEQAFSNKRFGATMTANMKRIKTGIPGLDKILGGGLLQGSAYIVHGTPGAGKTVFANQTCCNVAHGGGRALYVSLLAESHDRMMMHMSGMRFFDQSLVPNSIMYLSAFSTLNTEGLPGLLRLIFQESRRHDATLVVLDGLFVARGSARDEQDFRQFVHEIQGQAALGDRTLLILTNQTPALGSPEHTMVDGGIEFLDELRGVRAVRNIVVRKQRGGPFVRGRHQFRITDQGLEVFPRLEAVVSQKPGLSESIKRLTTGIEGLDRMIGGGYPAASTTIIAGPTGSGKTTIGLQFLADSTPEAPGLLFGFYETPARLRTKARSLGIDIDGLLASGALKIMWQSPAENMPDELGHRLIAEVRKGGVKRLFFDGIGGLRHAFVFPERLPLFVNAMSAALREMETTSIYTLELAQLFMPEEMPTDDLSQMVDNVILTHYAQSSDRLARQVIVLKIRDSAFDAYPEVFHVTDEGVRFGGDDAAARRPEGAKSASEGA